MTDWRFRWRSSWTKASSTSRASSRSCSATTWGTGFRLGNRSGPGCFLFGNPCARDWGPQHDNHTRPHNPSCLTATGNSRAHAEIACQERQFGEWSELKRAVHERAGGICERCKINVIDAVHHLTYQRKYAEFLEDLAGWCNGCHAFTHAKSDDDPAEEAKLYSPATLFVAESKASDAVITRIEDIGILIDGGDDDSQMSGTEFRLWILRERNGHQGIGLREDEFAVLLKNMIYATATFGSRKLNSSIRDACQEAVEKLPR